MRSRYAVQSPITQYCAMMQYCAYDTMGKASYPVKTLARRDREQDDRGMTDPHGVSGGVPVDANLTRITRAVTSGSSHQREYGLPLVV